MILNLLFYLTVFSLSLFLMYISDKKSDIIPMNYLIILSFSIPIIVTGLRYNVGTDFFSYVEIFDYVAQMRLTEISNYYLEIGASLIIYLSSKLNLGYSGMFLSFAIITYSLVYLSIRKKDNKLLIYYLFFMLLFAPSLNIMRNVVSVLCFVLVIEFFEEKKYTGLFLFFTIGFLFHKTILITLVYLAIYIFFKSNINSRKKYLLSSIFFAIAILTSFFTNKILIPMFTFFNIDSVYLSIESTKNYSFLLYILPPLLPVMFFFRKINTFDKFEKEKLFFYLFSYLTSIPIQVIGVSIYSFDRFAIYPMSLQLFLIPYLISLSKKYKYNHKKITLYYISWYLLYFIVMFIIKNGNGIVPYQTVFNK